MEKQNEQVRQIIKDNWSEKPIKDIAALIKKELGVDLSELAVRGRAKRMGMPPKKTGGQNKVVENGNEISLKEEIFKYILKTRKRISLAELSDKFDVGISKVRGAIETLEKEGAALHNLEGSVEIKTEILPSKPTVIDSQHLVGERKKFGFVTDMHLGSKYERLDALESIYDRFVQEGITEVYLAGNAIDGEARFNKFDIHTYGMENQANYFAKMYPRREGITTYFITGDDHEGWYVQREGVNIGMFMEDKALKLGRKDLVYLGHMEHDLVLKTKKGQAIMRIVHPGGGSSYAYSYTSQKLVESYNPGEKPHILLMGHYHKASYNYIRGVHVVQGGCFMDQSPFMRKKRLEAHVGGWICEYQQGENGVIKSFKGEFIPFYGKEFYGGEIWKYQY